MRIDIDSSTHAGTPKRGRRGQLARLAACLLIGLAGCRTDMYDQPKYEPYDPSATFPEGTSSRPLISGTVARGQLRADAHYYEGKVDGKDAEVFPFAVDEQLVQTGQDRFTVFCSMCHGQQGNGRGMVVRRGFSPPPDLHSEPIQKAPVGHIFDVITNGHGAMYGYAARIPVQHRWAIVAYIKALQYSQNADKADLTTEELKAATAAETPAAKAEHGAGSTPGEVKK